MPEAADNPAPGSSAPSGTPAAPAGLTPGQIGTLIGTIVVTAGGVIEEIVRVEGGRAIGASGASYDAQSVLAQPSPQPRPAMQNWIPWVVGGGLVLALLVGMGKK